jgi:hypothetical protein
MSDNQQYNSFFRGETNNPPYTNIIKAFYNSKALKESTARKKKKDPLYNLKIKRSDGLILTEGSFYNLRNGTIAYLMDQTILSDKRPFYLKDKDTGKTLADILPSGKCFDFMDSNYDVMSLHSCPIYVTASSDTEWMI